MKLPSPFKNGKVLLLASCLLLLAVCQPNPTRKTIMQQLRMYPASRVQDIYKIFCQDNLGPGHLIPNPGSPLHKRWLAVLTSNK